MKITREIPCCRYQKSTWSEKKELLFNKSVSLFLHIWLEGMQTVMSKTPKTLSRYDQQIYSDCTSHCEKERQKSF